MPDPLRILVVALTLAALPGWGRGQTPEREPARDTLARVFGTIVQHGRGTPLAGAAVSLDAGPEGTRGIGTRVTNREGHFLFQRVRPGTYTVKLDLMGYRPRRDTLHVGPGAQVRIRAEMSVSPVPLKPLLVVARRQRRGAMQGFEERRRTGIGSFIDREEIEERHPLYLSDLFRTMPGVRVTPAGSYGYGVRLRGGCRPALWVDGVRAFPGVPVDAFLLPMDVEAIEVYRASELPVRFGTSSCGAIVVWTRSPGAVTSGGSFWRRAVFGLGFLAAAYLLTR